MIRDAQQLKGSAIGAIDGDLGKIVDVYFNEEQWTIRYLAADTGGWLSGRKVLISPLAFGKTDWDGKRLKVELSKDQVKNSPSIDTAKPVSRQMETALHDYYQYPYYWTGPYLWGPASFPRRVVTTGTSKPEVSQTRAHERESDDHHLRSVEEVLSYYIEALDGDIGHVENFLVDDESWTLRYIVVDTKNWLPGKKVLVSTQWVKGVSWTDRKVFIELSRDAIKNSPEYDASRTIDRTYESQLHRHYQRPEYWGRPSL